MHAYLPCAHILKMASSRSVHAGTSRSAIGKIYRYGLFRVYCNISLEILVEISLTLSAMISPISTMFDKSGEPHS